MPGLYGGCTSGPDGDIRRLAVAMSEAMNPDRSLKTDQFLDEKANLFGGRVSLGIQNPVDQPVVDAETGIHLCFHGELLQQDAAPSDPEWLLSAYIRSGTDVFRSLHGMFHGMVYDPRQEKIRLFSDRFGLQPLYYTDLNGTGFAFAGEIKALLAWDQLSRTPDEAAMADFLHFGQVLGDKTLFRDVHLLPPASVLTYEMGSGRITVDTYWHVLEIFSENGNYRPDLNAGDVADLLAQAIEANASRKEDLGLSLSGGLDSRGILAGLREKAKGLATYTLGLAGCADQKLVEQMARAGETQHEFIELKQDYIGNFEAMAREMIRLSDGLYHPHESTEMLALEYFKRGPFKILLRGHGGEIAKASLAYPVMVKPEVYGCRNRKDILRYILNSTNLVLRDIEAKQLFTPSFADRVRSGPKHSLEESCGEAASRLAPADVCIYYYIQEHIRRQVVASLEIFRSQIDIRMPYLDVAYMENLLALPVRMRNAGEIHVALIKRCMPGLMKIPNSNTGAPLDAGRLRLLITDKFNSLMKRLSVKGYRHYTEFQDWHRKGFRDSSRQIIFDERTESRGLYHMDYLKQAFDAHASGRKDYGHLLGTIVGIELWFRAFVDG